MNEHTVRALSGRVPAFQTAGSARDGAVRERAVEEAAREYQRCCKPQMVLADRNNPGFVTS
jgi:hypothetical protein